MHYLVDAFELPRPASPLLTRVAYRATRRLLVEPAKKEKMTKKKASEALANELEKLQMGVLEIATPESDDISNAEEILYVLSISVPYFPVLTRIVHMKGD